MRVKEEKKKDGHSDSDEGPWAETLAIYIINIILQNTSMKKKL